MCHERLAIVGVDSGAQPLVSEDGNIYLCANGEIYNHEELRKKIRDKRRKDGRSDPVFKTGSDCEVILHLYEEYGSSCVNYLDGMFAFVLYDKVQDRYIAARDPIGIITLYQGKAADGSVWFASEMKALFEDCRKELFSFEPGTLYDSRHKKAERWFTPKWWDESWCPPMSAAVQKQYKQIDASSMAQLKGKVEIDSGTLSKLKDTLCKAVEKELMSEVPFGVLLSGGLDSSLIAAIAARYTAKAAQAAMIAAAAETEEEPKTPVALSAGALWSPRLHTFSVGLKGSPDLVAARSVAKHIGTLHHEFTFTVQDGIDAVREVIFHLESYDVTTIRASTPMYLMSRKIKAMGVKMVLSGEGSDEVFGGYLYFHQAPTPKELHVETVKRVKLLHTSDCLRANKSTMAWGLEARVPFLDTKLLDVAMTMPPEYKHPQLTKRQIEKEAIRQAFDVSEDDGFGHVKPYLPANILWRQKEQFSDGVGYSWIDTLKDYAESTVTEDEWNDREKLYPYNTPSTREAFFYRKVFEEFFCPSSLFKTPDDKLPILKTVVKWVPRKDWGCAEDPSGRAQKVHSEAYENSPKKAANGVAGEHEAKRRKQ